MNTPYIKIIKTAGCLHKTHCSICQGTEPARPTYAEAFQDLLAHARKHQGTQPIYSTDTDPHTTSTQAPPDYFGGHYWEATCSCGKWGTTARTKTEALAHAEAHQKAKRNPHPYGGGWWASCPHCEWLGTFNGEAEAKAAYDTHQEEKHDRTP